MKDVFQKKDSIKPLLNIPSINVFGKVKSEQMHPLFTITIPTYKRVKTLEDTINSALNQVDFNDYNIVVVDNNPERGDATEIFMQKYKNHPKIDYYKNSINVGMANNWNKCALLSKSEYFILLHDDDILSPYALLTFKIILDAIPNSWSLVKPNLMVFGGEAIPLFDIPRKLIIRQLALLDFATRCAVGAPSGILYNKKTYLEIGGCNSDDEFYPCVDYVNSLNLSMEQAAYVVNGCFLGGYRVENNASLSEEMMDKYFYNNYQINMQVLKRCHISLVLSKMILSAFLEERVTSTLKYYKMKDYRLKYTQFDVYKLSKFSRKGIRYVFRKCSQIYNLIHTKKIEIIIR